MTRITIKTKVDPSAKKTTNTIGVWWDDVKFKFSLTEKAFHSNAMHDLEVGVEKPGHFIMEHHPHKKHTRFQFHSRAEIANLPISLTFMHHRGPDVTSIEANAFPRGHRLKLTAKQIMGTEGPLVKIEQGAKKLTGKLQFDFASGRRDAFGFGIKAVEEGDYVEATYEHAKRRAEVVLCKNTVDGGPLKLTGVFPMKDSLFRDAYILLEKEWRFRI